MDREDISDIKLWPNPATEGVQLSFQAADESALTVNILNLLGQTVYTDKVVVQVGFNSHRMVWPTNLDGNYVVQVVSNQHVYTHHLSILA